MIKPYCGKMPVLKNKKRGMVEYPFQIMIERMIPGGQGIAFHEGRAVFAASSAPGDRLEVIEAHDRGNYLEVRRSRMIAPSPYRQSPPCPHYGPCGGCDFQHLSYEAQLEAKKGLLVDCLNRIGKITFPPDQIQLIPSPPFHYRNRIQIKVDSSNSSWGFFRTGSHQVEPLKECRLATAFLWEWFQQIRSAIQKIPQLEESLSELELLAAEESSLLLDIHLSPTAMDPQWAAIELRSLLESLLPSGSSGTLWLSPRERVQLFGTGHLVKQVGRRQYRVSHGVFFQVNEYLLEKLQTVAATSPGDKRALDLFCGAGFFTLALAGLFEEVVAVEANSAAASDLEAALQLNGIQNVQVWAKEFNFFIQRWTSKPMLVDFLLLDPPRAGLPPGTVAQVASLQVPEVVYVSCDPSTLARDLRIFLANHYRLEALTVLDLFPQTHHLETVARLKRV